MTTDTATRLNRKSRLVTEGVARTPNRAMLRAVGFGDGDFDKPIIAVANGYSTITPCNAGLNDLAQRAVESVRGSGFGEAAAGRGAGGVVSTPAHRAA